MAYRMLGIAVWKLLKWVVARKLGRTNAPRPALVAGGASIVAALAAFLRSRKGGSEGAATA